MDRMWKMSCTFCLNAPHMPLFGHAFQVCLTHCAPFQRLMCSCAPCLPLSTSMLLHYACTTCFSTGQRCWGSTHLPTDGADPSALAAAAAAAAQWRGSRRRWTPSRLWSHMWSQEHSPMPSEAPRAAAHASNLQLTTSRPLCERDACVAGHHACHMSATDCARPQSLPTANTCESVNGLYCCCVTAPLHSCLQSTPSSRPSPGVEGRESSGGRERRV
jgi:hypothetical protein